MDRLCACGHRRIKLWLAAILVAGTVNAVLASTHVEADLKKCPHYERYVTAKDFYLQAMRVMADKKWIEASILFDRGIDKLGEYYYALSPHLQDDTDQALVGAKQQHFLKKFSVEAHLKKSVLSSRLEVYRQGCRRKYSRH